MKKLFFLILSAALMLSCGTKNKIGEASQTTLPLEGTWKLLTGILIENGDTTVTDYTKDLSFIKIISGTHFAFLEHDLNKGRDSLAFFVAGGGAYSIKDSVYTEHLEYCSAREWEGNDFTFVVSIQNDTLIQKGMEKIEEAGVNRYSIERYVRVKN